MRTSHIVALILIAGALLVIYQQKRKIGSQRAEIEAMRGSNEIQAKIIDNTIAEDGTQHQTIEENTIYKSSVKVVMDSTQLDSLLKVIKVKDNQVASLTRVNAFLKGKIKATAVETDSLNNRTYTFAGKWLNARLSERDSILTYNYNADISIIKYWKRDWFLGKKKYYIDLSASDPNMKINGLHRFTVESSRPSPWGIGLHAGYYYDPHSGKMRPAVGVGVSYNLVRF